MENRMNDYFEAPEDFPEEKPSITVEVDQNERLMKITLEMEDQHGLLDDDLPEGFDGDAFIEEVLFVREREFETFVKVLHYNCLRYRVETLR